MLYILSKVDFLIIITHEYFHNKEFPAKLKCKFCKTRDMYPRITRTYKNDLYFNPPNWLAVTSNPVSVDLPFGTLFQQKLKIAHRFIFSKTDLDNIFLMITS